MTVTMSLPSFSGRLASSIAAQTFAPAEIPPRMPSSVPSRLRDLDGVVEGGIDDLVVDFRIEHLGHEIRSETLDLVRPGVSAGEDRGVFRFDADDPYPGFAFLEPVTHPGQCSAGADPGDEDVDRAVGVRPDLLGGRRRVDLRVGGVGELIGCHRVVGVGDDLLRLGHRAGHALGAGVNTISAPNARSITRRSVDMVSGMVRITLYPRAAPTIASAMPVLPLVASTMVPPGRSSPERSAASTIATPMRSLTLCAGL